MFTEKQQSVALPAQATFEPVSSGGFPSNFQAEFPIRRDRLRPFVKKPALSREEEIAQAQLIEKADRDLLEAVRRSPQALRELALLAEEVQEGSLGLGELVRDTADESDPQNIVQEILAAVQRARRVRPRRSGANRDATFADAVMKYQLSIKAVDRLIARLQASCKDGGAKLQSLRDTVSTMIIHRQESERARNLLVEANMWLVTWMANKKLHEGLSLSDLVQEGSMGLIRAVERFDYRRGIKFSTYAAWWIRHFMNRALSDQSRTIRVPVHLLETKHKVQSDARKFNQQYGRDPTEAELSEKLGLPRRRIRSVMALPKRPLSMEAPVASDTEVRVGDRVADPSSQSPLDDLSTVQLKDRLRQMVGTLTQREQEVLRLRFGLDGQDGLTLEEVGKRFSLTRERIRQIEIAALAKLRTQAEADDLGAHLSG